MQSNPPLICTDDDDLPNSDPKSSFFLQDSPKALSKTRALQKTPHAWA